MKKTNAIAKMTGVALAALALVAVGTGSAGATSKAEQFEKGFTGNQAKYQWDNFVKWIKSWF